MGETGKVRLSPPKVDGVAELKQRKENDLPTRPADIRLLEQKLLHHQLRADNNRWLTWRKVAWVILLALCSAAAIRHLNASGKPHVGASRGAGRHAGGDFALEFPSNEEWIRQHEEQEKQQQELEQHDQEQKEEHEQQEDPPPQDQQKEERGDEKRDSDEDSRQEKEEGRDNQEEHDTDEQEEPEREQHEQEEDEEESEQDQHGEHEQEEEEEHELQEEEQAKHSRKKKEEERDVDEVEKEREHEREGEEKQEGEGREEKQHEDEKQREKREHEGEKERDQEGEEEHEGQEKEHAEQEEEEQHGEQQHEGQQREKLKGEDQQHEDQEHEDQEHEEQEHDQHEDQEEEQKEGQHDEQTQEHSDDQTEEQQDGHDRDQNEEQDKQEQQQLEQPKQEEEPGPCLDKSSQEGHRSRGLFKDKGIFKDRMFLKGSRKDKDRGETKEKEKEAKERGRGSRKDKERGDSEEKGKSKDRGSRKDKGESKEKGDCKDKEKGFFKRGFLKKGGTHREEEAPDDRNIEETLKEEKAVDEGGQQTGDEKEEEGLDNEEESIEKPEDEAGPVVGDSELDEDGAGNGTTADEEETDESTLPHSSITLQPGDSVLEAVAPVFVSPRQPFHRPQCAKEKILNDAVEAQQLLEEQVGKDVSDAFIEFLTKELPKEDPKQMSTEALKSQVVERTKQKAALSVVQAFQTRRAREVALARMLILEQMELALKEHQETGSQLPSPLAELLEGSDFTVDLDREKAVLAAARRTYEEALAAETAALQVLTFDLMETAAHLTAADIFVRAAVLPADWKTKLPKYRDLATALTDVGGLANPSTIIHVPGMAGTVVEAFKAVMGDKTSPAARVGKLLTLADLRRRANASFKQCIDPQLDDSNERMVAAARRRAFDLTERAEKLRQEFASEVQGQADDKGLKGLDAYFALLM